MNGAMFPSSMRPLSPDEIAAIQAMDQPQAPMGGLAPAAPQAPADMQISPDEIAAFDAQSHPPGIADPWEQFAPLAAATQSPEVADPYESIRATGYGPQTSGQMASPEAPAYVPPSPPAAPNAKDAYSATDSQRELMGKTVQTRDVEGELGRLSDLRSQQTPQAAQGPGKNEQDFGDQFSGQDAKARTAFMLNWLSGGPEQAYRFQQAYEQKRAQYAQGLTAARDKDTALAQGAAPISDAQAQILVRTYGMSPESVANMTAAQWAKLEPVLKSTPYANNQAQAREQRTDVDLLKVLASQRANEADNAADYGQTQLRGENALRAVRANKEKAAGGGGGGPRDLRAALITAFGADQAGEVDAVISGMQQGTADDEFPPELQDKVAMYRQLEAMPGKEWGKIAGKAYTSAAVARTNKAFATDEGVRAKQLDPEKRMKISSAWRTRWNGYQQAAHGFKQLQQSGKLDLLVKAPYGSWNSIIDSQMSGADQNAARQISAFINPTMREQTGAALSQFEKDMSFSQFGISGTANPFASPDKLLGFLKQSRDMIMDTKQVIDGSYPGLIGGQ